MGSGASAAAEQVNAAVKGASESELQEAVSKLSAEEKAKILAALDKASPAADTNGAPVAAAADARVAAVVMVDGKLKMPEVEDKIYAGVVDGLPDLSGRCVAVTGCTSGTGFWFAVAAVRKKAACVLLLNRKSDRADAAEAKVKAEVKEGVTCRVETVECDLQSFDSVKACGAKVAGIAKEFGGLDALCNNAGVMAVPDKRTPDGFDVQMQTNHLSHFLLTKLCMPSLEAAAESRGEARVVQHSSGARGGARAADGVGHLLEKFFQKVAEGELGGDDPQNCFNRYHQTKLANPVFCMALHDKLTAAGKTTVKSLVGEPGVAVTELAGNLMAGHKAAESNTKPFEAMLGSFKAFQSGADGACPIIMCAFAADANGGDFYMPGDQVEGITMGMPVKCVEGGQVGEKCPQWAKDKFESEKLTMHMPNRELLWTASEAAVGEPFAIA